MKRITMADMAKALNISISTVSKALAGSDELSKGTKEMVMRYAKKNNYQFNMAARALRMGTSGTIGIIVPFIDNSFFSQVLDGMEEMCDGTDYKLLVMQSKDNVDVELSCIQTLYHRGVDGLIISPIGNGPGIGLMERLIDENFPVVIFDRIHNILDTHKVGVKNKEDSFRATEHLIQSGFSQIAHLTGDKFGVILERLDGYKNCLQQYEISINDNFIHFFDSKDMKKLKSEVRSTLSVLLQQTCRPDAIFTGTDVLTTTTLMVLNELKACIPQQVALIGYCNSFVSEVFNPSLSCIYQPGEEMGKTAMAKLFQLFEINRQQWPIQYETIQLETEIIIRDSTNRIKQP